MKTVKAVLFDLDGVVVDTEGEYTVFWSEQGRRYHPEIADFARGVKGYTLVQLFNEYFADMPEARERIVRELDVHERNMAYKYVSGVQNFIKNLRASGIKTAIVTSSNNQKMSAIYGVHPELKENFDVIITADDVSKSKPDPEGYLLAAKRLGAGAGEAVVFEDSLSGLRAGRASGMAVIALTGTIGLERVKPLSDLQIDDYLGVDVSILDEAQKIKFS